LSRRLDDLIDKERIDVSRGHQITEFGQHAYSGAISIVTNKPDFGEFYGNATGEIALPDKTHVNMMMNIPVTDTLAFRLAGLSETRSGWINTAARPDITTLQANWNNPMSYGIIFDYSF